mgnify:CR=1 FL=1
MTESNNKEEMMKIIRDIMTRYEGVFRELAKGPESTPPYLSIDLDDVGLKNIVFRLYQQRKAGQYSSVTDWDVVWRAFADAIVEDVDREEIFNKLKRYWFEIAMDSFKSLRKDFVVEKFDRDALYDRDI